MYKIASVLLAILLLAGCANVVKGDAPVAPIIPAQSAVLSAQPSYSPDKAAIEPPRDRTWINPGKVQVGNYYAGAVAESTLRIHNGGAEAAPFLVEAALPDTTGAGYVSPPSFVLEWIKVSNSNPTIGAYETYEVVIALEMPLGAQSPPKSWEIWIVVKDNSQKSFVQTALASRWLVNMR